MAANTCEMRSNGIKIAFFFQKLTKIAQRFGALSMIRLSTLAYSTRLLS